MRRRQSRPVPRQGDSALSVSFAAAMGARLSGGGFRLARRSACARESARSAVRRAGAPSDGAAGPLRALPKRSRAARRRADSGGLALLVQSRPDADGAGNAARPAVGRLGQTHAELTRQKSRRQRRDIP